MLVPALGWNVNQPSTSETAMQSIHSLPAPARRRYAALRLLAVAAAALLAVPAVAASYTTATRTVTGGSFAIAPDARSRLYLDAGESPRAAEAARAALVKRGFAFVDRKEDAVYVISVRGAIGIASERKFMFVPIETYYKASSEQLVAQAGDAPRTALTSGPGSVSSVWPVLAANVLLNIAQLASASNPNPTADFDQMSAYRHAGGIGPSAVLHLNVRPVADAQRKLPNGFVRGQAIADGASWDVLDPAVDYGALLTSAAEVAAETLAKAAP